MQYGHIEGVSKPISRIVFGTATPKLFAAFRSVYEDAPGLKGYACPENFERLRRCEILAREKGLTVPQVAMAWIFNQRALDVYALVSTSWREKMRVNVASSEIRLTDAECAWLDLEGAC